MNPKSLYVIRLLFLILMGTLLYLAYMAHSGEVFTVWDNLPPIFLPTLFAASLVLLVMVLSASEKLEYKLLWVIIYSIVCRSFSEVIFPGGGIGPQAGEGLSITRLIFDSTIRGSWAPWPPDNPLILLYNALRGENFHSVLTVIFARMFAVDVYWTHIWLSPVLWGAFVPITTFAMAKALGGNDTTSILASLLITVFPYTILWGTLGAANSLGFVFFLISTYFFLRYLSSTGGKILLPVAIFFTVSILSHLLSGIMAVSVLILAIAVKAFNLERGEAPLLAKTTLVLAFLLSAVLLPFSLLFQRVIYAQYTTFTLNAFTGLPITRVLSLLAIGYYADLSVQAAFVFLAGPVLGFVGIIYMFLWRRKKLEDRFVSLNLLFVLLGYVMVLADYRILKFFMIFVPFDAERLLVFEYFLVVPFVAFAVYGILTYLVGGNIVTVAHKGIAATSSTLSAKTRLRAKHFVVYGSMAILLAAWLTSSVYYAYPHVSSLQVTDYEIDAATYIDAETNGSYIVICDQWFDYAGGMLVGINNTRAFYFSVAERTGIESFSALRADPSVTAINKTLAPFEQEGIHFQTVYFIVSEQRLGTDEFSRIVAEATENKLGLSRTFGDGKLFIFYYSP